ncbi:hypothetical protein ACFQV8_29515 [Pseudonocardia benzenivorans]
MGLGGPERLRRRTGGRRHAGDATVTVRLHTERADGPGIRAGLEQTLAEIKTAVEGTSTS